MLHPSYTDLMKVVNKDVEDGENQGSQQPLFHRDGYIEKSKTVDRRRASISSCSRLEINRFQSRLKS